MVENNSLKKESNEDTIPPKLNLLNSNISNTIDYTNKNHVLVKKIIKKRKKKPSNITNEINLISFDINNQKISQIRKQKNNINSNRISTINKENKIIEEINTNIKTNKNQRPKRRSLKIKNDFKICN